VAVPSRDTSNRLGKRVATCIASVSFVLYKTNTENVLEVIGKNRSVMPFDVLGCTRATMTMSASFLAWAKALANLRNVVVLWIVDCNYST
jgi:hypothetical protein